MTEAKGRKRKPRLKTPETPWEPDTRDLEIYSRVCAGGSERKVAAKYDLTGPRIHQIVHRVDSWLAAQLMDQIREIKARHTFSLEYVFREALAAWRRSKEDAVSVTETVGGGEGGNSMSTTTKGQCGNAAYLAEARNALEQIREIWGANAPLQIEHTGEIRVAGRDVKEIHSDLQERMNRILQSGVN